MPYITSVEEIGFERGLEQGLEQGRQEERRSLTFLLLEQRVGPMPDAFRDRVAQLNLQQLEALAIALLNFATLSDLESWLQTHLPSD